MLLSRWLALVVFIFLIILIGKYDTHSWREKVKHYGMTMLEGMVGGLIVDSIGVNAGYYYFPRQPLYSLNYWLIVIPAWGVFGLTLNILWNQVSRAKFVRGTLITTPALFLWYEGTNLVTNSWVYTVPLWVVVMGWIPLVYVFAGCDHRRDVVFKIEQWIQNCNDSRVKISLQVLRIAVMILMFPLLLVSITQFLRRLVEKKPSSYKEVLRDYLMLRSV